MTSAPGNQVGDKYVLPTGNNDVARLDVIHAVYGAVSMELIAGMEKHTANPEVWVAVAKMLAVVGRKPLQ